MEFTSMTALLRLSARAQRSCVEESAQAGRPARSDRTDVTGFTPVTAWVNCSASEVRREAPRTSFFYSFGDRKRLQVAKTSPGELIRQVRAEASKVVWPSRKETVRTAIMVMIMTTLLALFFLGVDSAFSAIVQFLLGLIG